MRDLLGNPYPYVLEIAASGRSDLQQLEAGLTVGAVLRTLVDLHICPGRPSDPEMNVCRVLVNIGISSYTCRCPNLKAFIKAPTPHTGIVANKISFHVPFHSSKMGGSPFGCDNQVRQL